MDEQLTILMNRTIDELAYWKQRCLAAEKFIQETPCDPDITNTQIEAQHEWKELIKQEKK